MITTSSLVLDGPHGLGPGGPHHMSFVEPYLRSKIPNSEFLRPLPKPAPLVPRYNGRPSPAQSPRKDYLPPATSAGGPVNLAKNDEQLETSRGSALPPHLAPSYTSRMYPHAGFYSNPYPIYASPYSALLTRPTYINTTPMSPMESQYSQQVSQNNPAFRSPGSVYSHPQPHPPAPPPTASKPLPPPHAEKRPFKVPPGRELKNKVPLRSKRPGANHNNNNTLPPNFTKGSLIQLGNGDLRRVEDVSTEDLVSSAERCSAFRLDPSTVVRIEEGSSGLVVLTLSHGENKRTVDIETTTEHPYYIYGRGWASCSPERTLSCYGLNCQRLQVGDVCVSLSPRQTSVAEPIPPVPTVPSADSDSEDKSGKRRRWSAPDQIDVEEEIIDPGSPVHKRVNQ